MDLTLWFGERHRYTRKLDYELYQKPTNLYTPLGDDSMHPWAVLRSWPGSMIARLQKRTHNRQRCQNTIDAFKHKIKITVFDEYFATIFPLSASRKLCNPGRILGRPQSRIILHLHPAFVKLPLSNFISEVQSSYDSSILPVGVAWAVGGKHMQKRVKTIYHFTGELSGSLIQQTDWLIMLNTRYVLVAQGLRCKLASVFAL